MNTVRHRPCWRMNFDSLLTISFHFPKSFWTSQSENIEEMFLADFHIHSTFSDGKLAIPEIVDLYGSLGFGAIAITDHLCENATLIGKASAYLRCTLTEASFPLYRELLKTEAERAWDQYRMVVIPGVELTKNSVSNHRSVQILVGSLWSNSPRVWRPCKRYRRCFGTPITNWRDHGNRMPIPFLSIHSGFLP